MSYNDKITTLAFDWGGTLMAEDRQFSGAMVNWPAVQAVAGVLEALQALQGHYQMVVVTNAAESDAGQVRAALKRVELDSFFSHIFTYNEVKARKPDPQFFRAVENAVGAAPHQLAMVGDSFWADVAGACQAGWQAVWYNPYGLACPGLTPPHQAELVHMSGLPAALNHLQLPDLQTCHLWCLEQGFSFATWQHVSLVAAIAYQMAVWLRSSGLKVDPILAQRGGLLHDLAKITTPRIGTDASHAEVGASLLRERGQFELAEITLRHMIQSMGTDDEPGTWEEKLVHFADKLAEGSKLVELDERLQALYERYPEKASLILQRRDKLVQLQEEIARAAGIQPGELVSTLKAALKGI